MSVAENKISSFYVHGVRYVLIEDCCGGSMSLPYEDWEDARRYLGLTADSHDLIRQIDENLYVDVGTRLVHKW